MIDPGNFTNLISKYEDGVNAVDVYDKFLEEDGTEISGGEVEFEVRFLSKSEINNRRKPAVPNVGYHEYKRVVDEFVTHEIEPEVTYDDFFSYVTNPSPLDRNVTSEVTFRRTTDIDGHATWIIKHKMYKLDILEYNIRTSISTEEYIDEEFFSTDDNGVVTYYQTDDSEGIVLDFMSRREKHRLAAEFDSGNQIHMTEIITSGITTYEIEIEYKGQNLTNEDLITINEEIEDVFRVLYGTYNVYTESERLFMVKFVNDLHNKPISNDISSSIMVESRNLKFGDLRMGGVVGSNIQYALTDKADGQRYLLIIHDIGVWLAFPGFKYNLISRIDWQNVDPNIKEELYGFICDGEDVPLENRLNDIVSKTWFLMFDTLAIKSNISIQNNKDLNYRLQQLRSVKYINEIIDPVIIKVDIKSFYYINSVDKFFESSSLIVKINKESRGYKTDGIVITPINEIYNPHRGKIPLKNRVLTSYSDICKWKPDITIDLSVGNNKLKTVKYENGIPTYIDFIGSELIPFDPSNYKNDTIQDLLENTVVEFKWDTDKLVPIRIRYDKKYPNPEHIAKDNWEHIHNAITEDTITGRNTKLMRKYHNRIKRELFLSLPEGSTLLDIASGSGGDVEKWKRFSKIVAVEPNIDYIEDRVINGKTVRGLKSRIQKAGMTDRVKIVNTIGQDTDVITRAVYDFLGDKADNCSIMLGMSFLWDSEKSFNALVSTISNNTKNSLIFMTIDGDAVKQMWEPYFSNIKAPKRLEIGDRTMDKKEVDYIEYDPNRSKGPILVNIGDIVTDQYEHLVFLEDLMRYFYTNRIYRADQEKFLNKSEKILSMLYSYGAFDLNQPDIKYKKKSTVDIIKSYPSFNNKTNTEDIKEIVVVEDTTGDIVEDVVENISVEDEVVAEDIPVEDEVVVEDIPVEEEDIVEEEVVVAEEVIVDEDIPVEDEVVVEDEVIVDEDIPVEDEVVVVEDIPVEDEVVVAEDIVEVEVIADEEDIPIDLAQRNVLLNTHGKALPMLPKSTGKREKEYSQVLNVKWYDEAEVVRISALADGSCFLHAYLKGFYNDYQDNDSAKARTDVVLNLRRDLAVKLSKYNPEYQHFADEDYYYKLIDKGYDEKEATRLLNEASSNNQIEGYVYWTTAGNGKNVDLLTQQIIDPQIILEQGYDSADIKSMKQDINSTRCISDLHIINICDMVGVDVVIFRGFEGNLTFHMTTYKVGRERPIVCLVHTSKSNHYELIGVVEDNDVKTVFTPNDPFIARLFSLVQPDHYYIDHPEDIFIEAIIRNYIDYGKVNDEGSIVIPNILDITELDDNDPYVQNIYSIFKYNDKGEIVLKDKDIQNYKEYLRKQGFSI